MSHGAEDYLIPIVLGVAAQNGISADEERLSGAISDQMIKIRNTFPNSPFLIISSLAAHEERLAARLAADLLQAGLIVVLPFRIERYKETFGNDEEAEDFSELLEQALFSVDIIERTVVRKGKKKMNTDADEKAGWSHAAAYIAEQTEILLQVTGDGGSGKFDFPSMIVDYMREGGASRESPLNDVRSGLYNIDKSMIISVDTHTYQPSVELLAPGYGADDGTLENSNGIYEITADRASHIQRYLMSALYKIHEIYGHQPGDDTSPKLSSSSFTEIMERIDCFNRDITEYREVNGDKELSQSWKYLFGNEAENEIISGNNAIEKLAAIYTASDVLSQHFQRKTTKTIKWIYILFFIAVLLYGVIDMSYYLVLFYIALIPAIALLIRKTSMDRIEDRFLDYRALAEGLRVEIFWTLSGVGEKVSSHYLSKYAGLLTWIRKAVKSAELVSSGLKIELSSSDRRKSLEITRKLWIESQLEYFSTKRLPICHKSRKFGGIASMSFIITLLVAVVFGIYVLAAGESNQTVTTNFEVLLGAIAAVGVTAQAYKNKMAYDEIERRYSMARQTYASARREFESGKMRPEKILTAVGIEALMENSDWLWIHRSVPLEVPKG